MAGVALLALQQITQSGLAPAFVAAAAGGDSLQPGDSVKLHVKNGGAGSVTVTVNSQRKCDQGVDHDLAVAIAAGAEAIIGPLPANRFADPADGLVKVTYSAVTSVTVAALAG